MLAAGAVCAASGFAAWAVRGRSSNVFAPSVWRGSPHRRAIALTFDDGPSEATPDILELLERHGVRGTFFQCGANAARLPGIAREVALAGHEIGNHTYSHAALFLKPTGFIRQELTRAQQTIAEASGAIPKLFRAPFGARWFGLGEAQAALGLTGVMWTVLALDWKLPARLIARRVLRLVSHGAILCMHDGRGTWVRPNIRETVSALRELLPRLCGLGYSFETVSELLAPTSASCPAKS
jgi:peptidoglycan-N-acetylglucosamine deacetylase